MSHVFSKQRSSQLVRRLRALRLSAAAGLLLGLTCLGHAQPVSAPTPLRVMVHSSFSLPKPLLAQFEADHHIKLNITKGGDAGEMLNKLIVTRKAPIADVVFGLDNTLVAKANKAGILAPYTGPANALKTVAQAGANLVAVDFGHVNINVDKAAFAKRGVPLPSRLEDLTLPAYKNMLVVQNPATSSTGYAFLLATIAGLGEKAAFDWWQKMRHNGLKVAKGWTEAYYTDFSQNGGSYPLVVSYASSPAAEVFYSKEKRTESPTANVFLKGGVWRQVEGVGLIQGGNNVEAAGKWIEWLRSDPVQTALQTSMWMAPVSAHIPRADVFKMGSEPQSFETFSAEEIEAKGAQWVQRFVQTVLR